MDSVGAEMSAEVLALAVACATFTFILALLIAVFATGCGPLWLLSALSRCVRSCKKRKSFNWTEVDSLLYLGTVPREAEHLAELEKQGVAAVVTLNESWELPLSFASIKDDFGMDHIHLPTPDFFAPSQADIAEAVEFVSHHVEKGQAVYVHCNGGRGRSAVCVLCFLIAKRGMTAQEAFRLVRSKRKIANMLAWGGLHKQWMATKSFERSLKKKSPSEQVSVRQVVPAED
mmetsp:Transcript_90012/g.160246  ORF Transcript_90012/g.160246 Transcript_90012/m.160246 type:complete len:231 (+) Transcript_90012:107-799(+)|eukprot:CAMPEP_0197656840 /NCGR_PEP_ID=MMETSP1338-20131121/43627_1 /TAXON_ID=43686 ORGANISM="Pelagodinium beii, Strain RCC1491" /NCGR_SAMPLE_ID=MMETSP1338 /ASSEMBLY_ACC=CAM_ASM_000754 /LENGTH=230 /DNA_ID=CAMNT_0043233041 /DNA_START=38 /DNA_END=730 /DNA_ORIENTATION=-